MKGATGGPPDAAVAAAARAAAEASPEERRAMRRAARLTGESVAADIAARYLIDCLKHMTGIINDKPVAPWLAPALFEAVGR